MTKRLDPVELARRKALTRAKMRLRKPTPEASAKRAESMRRKWQETEYRQRVVPALRAARALTLADPEKRAALSARSSAWMKQLHQDPEFQARRDERSSRVMKANWEKHRDAYVQYAIERFANGDCPLNKGEGDKRKREANKWIMTRCREELIANTEYATLYKRIQEETRLSMPYDGPDENSFYMEYLAKLGRAVVNHPELRSLQDNFMRAALPRFAGEWKAMKPTS